jgi:predicted GIY-YIG superfamily endonuclease
MKKTLSTLRPIKDDLGLKTSGVYSIPCECDKVYVGRTSRIIEIRCQEHIRHPRHGQTEKSTVAEYLLNTGHEIQFEKTHRLDKTTTYVDQTMKGTT